MGHVVCVDNNTVFKTPFALAYGRLPVICEIFHAIIYAEWSLLFNVAPKNCHYQKGLKFPMTSFHFSCRVSGLHYHFKQHNTDCRMCEYCNNPFASNKDAQRVEFAGFFSSEAIDAAVRQAALRRSDASQGNDDDDEDSASKSSDGT
jgi:hypothetical protein